MKCRRNNRDFVTCDFVTLSTFQQSAAKCIQVYYKLYNIIILYNSYNLP